MQTVISILVFVVSLFSANYRTIPTMPKYDNTVIDNLDNYPNFYAKIDHKVYRIDQFPVVYDGENLLVFVYSLDSGTHIPYWFFVYQFDSNVNPQTDHNGDHIVRNGFLMQFENPDCNKHIYDILPNTDYIVCSVDF